LGVARNQPVPDGVPDEPYTVEKLPQHLLNVDLSYQHHHRPQQVAEIAEGFDEYKLQPLVVNRRPDGTYWVIDGRHRLEAIRRRGDLRREVWCVVYDGHDRPWEARMFELLYSLQKRKPYQALFAARLAADDPAAHEIVDILARYAYEANIDNRRESPTAFTGLHTVSTIYDLGGAEHLRTVIECIHDAWYGMEKSTSTPILLGVHFTIGAHIDQFNTRKFVRRMREVTPLAVIRKAREFTTAMSLNGTNGGYCIYRAIVTYFPRICWRITPEFRGVAHRL